MNSPERTTQNRRIRVFISSTFLDMVEDRNDLMTHTWPELRRLCQERHVELVEVDLRWGIAEAQSNRRETLKLCLDEIRACRPFFIGLLGERYGWVPGVDAFTADLREEQPWLRDVHGKSVTELEILHGFLNNPDIAGRACFYFRNPAYAQTRSADFQSEDPAADAKQKSLKTLIKKTCNEKKIPLRENYPDPRRLAALVLADLTAAIEAEFPKDQTPDALTREAQDHEAFAETRRRTYIGRPDYFAALDRHAAGGSFSPSPPSEGGEDARRADEGVPDKPLLLLGDSGSGKSALLANWVAHWRQAHPKDYIFQHYIGGTADSADHWRFMSRLMGEIKRWSGDPEDMPTKHDDILRDFPLRLAKARAWAEHEGVRFIVVLDALNQLEDHDHVRLLGWLPEHPFTGPLRLIVSTLPGQAGADDPLAALQPRHWPELRVQPLTVAERRRMIADYLARFGKKLDEPRLERLAAAPPAANPLYLKILLDDLRVTGTHDRLEERLTEYLVAADIPALLKQVLARYQRDYERDCKGLVGDTLGLIYAARRGLTERELLQLLRPAIQTQLPPAIWSPFRAALEEGLVDRGGTLNFAHHFLRTAVETVFVPDAATAKQLRLRLADYFAGQPVSARACDELTWLLWRAEQRVRLRARLLNMEQFLTIRERDQEELMRYWVWLHEERTMGHAYLASFEAWAGKPGLEDERVACGANALAFFLDAAALHTDAEPLMQRALTITEQSFGRSHPRVAVVLNNLGRLLQATNRPAEAEPLLRQALAIREQSFGPENRDVAQSLNNLALLLYNTNRLAEAEPLYRRALAIWEKSLGMDHPQVAAALNNLALLLHDTNRSAEAEPLMRRAALIWEHRLGANHENVASGLTNLAGLLEGINQLAEVESLYRRALAIRLQGFGTEHPFVAESLNFLARFLHSNNRLAEAEPLFRRALSIRTQSFGPKHPCVAESLNNLAVLLQTAERFAEAEPLMRQAMAIDETSFGPDHPSVARDLNNLAQILKNTDRLVEAELLMRRALTIDESSLGLDHPSVARALNNLAELYCATNRFAEAEPLLRRAMVNMVERLGVDHPSSQAIAKNYAQLLQMIGNGQTL